MYFVTRLNLNVRISLGICQSVFRNPLPLSESSNRDEERTNSRAVADVKVVNSTPTKPPRRNKRASADSHTTQGSHVNSPASVGRRGTGQMQGPSSQIRHPIEENAVGNGKWIFWDIVTCCKLTLLGLESRI